MTDREFYDNAMNQLPSIEVPHHERLKQWPAHAERLRAVAEELRTSLGAGRIERSHERDAYGARIDFASELDASAARIELEAKRN